MRIGVDIGVDIGSHEACCGEGRGERVICALVKGWYTQGPHPGSTPSNGRSSVAASDSSCVKPIDPET